MKQNILLLVGLLFFFSATVCLSQKIIPQAGLTLSRVTLNSNDTAPAETDMNLKFGLTAGVGVEFPLSERFSFQSGINYIQKGYRSGHKTSIDGFEDSRSRDFKLNYLQVPLLFRIVLGKISENEFYIITGLNGSYFIDGKLKIASTTFLPSTGTTLHGSSSRNVVYEKGKKGYVTLNAFYLENRMDVGIFAGFGMQLSKKFNIEIGFTQGLIGNEYWDGDSSANQVLQLIVSTPIDMFPGRKILKGESSN